MSNEFIIEAEIRDVKGKGASRRLRRLENKVPAILYGENQPSQNLSIITKDLAKVLENEAAFSHILTLNVSGEKTSVILKDLQRHPAKGFIIHADFLRVAKDHAITVNVPLHFVNEEISKGVKSGGQVQHQMTEVEVKCLPGDLPEYIEVDMKDVELETIVHLSDIKLPKGVELVALSHGEDHDLPVVAIHKAKGAAEETTEEGTEE